MTIKKSLISLFLLTPLTTFGFNFINNKNENGSLNSDFLKEVQTTFGCDTFVETGTYDGKTARAAASLFQEVHTIELHESLYQAARLHLADASNVTVYNGPSAQMIQKVVPRVEGKILFWLDAHYSGEGTAMSNDNPYDPQAITPICDELKSIKQSGVNECVILIDDIR